MTLIGNIISSYMLGLLTPLTAVCVLPLYPGFIAYLSSRLSDDAKASTRVLVGIFANAGIMSFMLGIGLVFTTLLEVSLTRVIGVISPIAFALLGIISLLLLSGRDMSLPARVSMPQMRDPLLSSYVFGLFFGAIVVPCNPGFIAAHLAKSLIVIDPVSKMAGFFAFGIGLGTPIMAFAAMSAAASAKVIAAFTSHKIIVNRVSGALMLAVSLYYLIYVFGVLG